MSVKLITPADTNPFTRQIIAVDGEGWAIDLSPDAASSNPHVRENGWHSYVMLAGADDKGYRNSITFDGSRQESEPGLARNYGLPTGDCIDFLLDLPRDALVCGFYFSYDTVKLLCDLPQENLEELATEKKLTDSEYWQYVNDIAAKYGLNVNDVHTNELVCPTYTIWDGYYIMYVPRKELKIIDLTAGREWTRNTWTDKKTGRQFQNTKTRSRWRRSVIVWDTHGFFQASFINVLKKYRCGQCEPCKSNDGICAKAPWTESDLNQIQSMKDQRGIFTAEGQREILEYCYKECEYLAFLVRDLLINIESFGLKMKRYDGSGAIASAWMTRERIKNYLPVREINGPEMFLSGLPETIALSGYYGGRFEISEMGFMRNLHSYDINSAYPAITAELPCLAHGSFRRVSEYVPGAWGIYLCGSETSGRWAPFPFRTDEESAGNGIAKDGMYYGHGGKRWIWSNPNPAWSEIGIARKHFGDSAIPVYDGWIWEPECDHKPFAEIPDLYSQRQEFVRAGNGIEKVIKLILNSLYGKTAQSVGWKADGNGNVKPPATQCFIWAGMITSGTRAMILDAIMQPDADVVSIATDGILSRTEIKALPCPDVKILGEWEHDAVTDGYLFQSGVYRYINGKGKEKYATRGFAPREIPAAKLIDYWNRGDMPVPSEPGQTRFITMRGGLMRSNPLEFIGQWIPSEHDVKFTHNRRSEIYPDPEPGKLTPDLFQICRESKPCDLKDFMSVPYSPKQSWEDVMEAQNPDEFEGDVIDA